MMNLKKTALFTRFLAKAALYRKGMWNLFVKQYLKEIEEFMKKIIDLGSVIDLTKEEIIEMFNILYEVDKE